MWKKIVQQIINTLGVLRGRQPLNEPVKAVPSEPQKSDQDLTTRINALQHWATVTKSKSLQQRADELRKLL